MKKLLLCLMILACCTSLIAQDSVYVSVDNIKKANLLFVELDYSIVRISELETLVSIQGEELKIYGESLNKCEAISDDKSFVISKYEENETLHKEDKKQLAKSKRKLMIKSFIVGFVTGVVIVVALI